MDCFIEKNYDDKKKAFKLPELVMNTAESVVMTIIQRLTTTNELAVWSQRNEYTIPRNLKIQFTHKVIAQEIMDLLEKDKFVQQEDKNAVEFFPPVIQSGGFYNFDGEYSSDENYFRDDVVILRLRARYKQYCSIIIRTLIPVPNKNRSLEENCRFMSKVETFVIDKLIDGIELGEVYQNTYDFVKRNRCDLLPNLTDNFGYVVGLDPGDKYFVIKANSKEIAKENMIFTVIVEFHSIYDSDLMERPPHTYSLCIADMVNVKKGKSDTELIGSSRKI